MFFSIYNILTAIVPIVIMILFSVLIIGNIHRSHQRTHPLSDSVSIHQQNLPKSSQDNGMQFIRLTIIQSLSFTFLNISFVAYVIYDAVTSSNTKSPDQRAIDGFLYGLSVHPIYVFSSVSY